MTRIGWLDCSAGVSGDMLLGALAGVGVELSQPAGLPVDLRIRAVRRAGLAATRVTVELPASPQPRRTLGDIRALLADAGLIPEVRDRALAVFGRLAAAEGAVHGIDPAEVHFHEVGALDAIADVVGVCAGFAALGLHQLHCSPVALGGGRVHGEHGDLPVPGPAVLELLRAAAAPAYGGPLDVELCTPTGAALLAEWVTEWGPLPAMRIAAVGAGAGGRDTPGQPNVTRLVVGETVEGPTVGAAIILAANVDDLDPRIWPHVLARLLDAGADDAWLSPIQMKKGRPAHTLSALCEPAALDAVRRVVFAETSTIGVRQWPVAKTALDRETRTVSVDGQPVRVKLAHCGGRIVNASVEHDDAVAAATALGRPVKAVLATATAAAHAAGLLP